MTACELIGVTKTTDGKHVVYHASDPQATYDLVEPSAVKADYNPALSEFVDAARVDYDIAPGNTKDMPYGVPMSYLSVTNVEQGTRWFMQNTKYPDLVCEMLARYEFGDLKDTTKKEFRNLKKRTAKKASKPKFEARQGNFLVEFD